MKQPRLGIVATAAVLVLALLVIALLGTDLFMGWASYAIMGAIPFALVVGGFWGGEHPRSIARLAQPARGLAYLGLAAVVAAVVSVVHWLTRGGGLTPPAPMAVMTIITSVVTAFFLVIAFGGWPFGLLRNKLAGGIALLVSAYVVNAGVFQLMDFGFAKGSPAYRAALDPAGPFAAWDVVTVLVTALALLFLSLHFGGLPATGIAALRRQPVLGVAWTLLCVVLAVVVHVAGTAVSGLPAPTFLVTVPIPFLFGSILVLNMLGGSLFAGRRQPVRGILSALVAAVVGVALARGYAALMPVVSAPLPAGPSGGFAAEVWLANSLLAVTFPFLAFLGDFFQLWPFARRRAEVAQERPVGVA